MRTPAPRPRPAAVGGARRAIRASWRRSCRGRKYQTIQTLPPPPPAPCGAPAGTPYRTYETYAFVAPGDLFSRPIPPRRRGRADRASQDIAGGFDIASPEGLASLSAEMPRQAAMIGYINAFLLFALVAAIATPLVLLLRNPE